MVTDSAENQTQKGMAEHHVGDLIKESVISVPVAVPSTSVGLALNLIMEPAFVHKKRKGENQIVTVMYKRE